MAVKNLIPKIQLSADEQTRLINALNMQIAIAVEFHNGNWDEAHSQYWRDYLAEPRVKRKMTPWPDAPLADDMEILTRRGWLSMPAVEIGDYVLSQDPHDKACAWMPVIDKQEQAFDEMLLFESKSVSQCVSPGHKVVIESYHDGEYQYGFTSAEKIFNRPMDHMRIPLTSSRWMGEHRDTLFGLDAGDACEFVGWYISEGWTYQSGTIGIGQSEKANPKKCRDLEALFDRLGFSWRKTKDRNQYLVKARTIPAELRCRLSRLGTATQKYIPRDILDLSEQFLGRLLDGLIAGDGYIRPPRPHQNYPQACYYTTSKRLADDVQELVQKIGKRGTISIKKPMDGGAIQGRTIHGKNTMYSVSINTKTHAKVVRLKKTRVPYGRKAYCVTTPWHTIYVRRNGIASWTGNSNLVIPITQVIIEGIIAQEFDAMFANEPVMSVKGQDSGDYETQEILSQYYGEYLYKEVIDMKQIGGDLLLDNCVDGTSAAKVRWNRDTAVRRVQSIEEEPVIEKVRGEFLGATIEAEQTTAIQYRSVETATIETIDEPAVDASDLSRLYVAPDSGPSLEWPDCRWYYQVQNLTWDDLVERRRKGYDNIDDELKARLTDRDLTEKERQERRNQAVNESAVEKMLEVTEHYMRWPLPARYQRTHAENEKREAETVVDQKEDDEEGYQEEIIVTYCAKARKLLRVVPLMRLYPDGKRPHVDMRYHRLPRFYYGIGIPSKMKYIQSGTNSAWNQWLDNGTLQNIPFYFYEPATAGDMPNMMGLTPGQGIPVLNASGVQFPRFSNSDNQFWLAALQQLQNWGEKVGNINDYTQGRAPTTPNAPRTASGQQMMLQAGQVAFARLVALHAARFVEIFRRIHALHKKNAKPETYFRVLNKDGVYQKLMVPNRLFQREVDFQFVLNPNRAYEQQQAMQLFQMIVPYLMQFNPAGIRPLAKEIWTLNGKKNFDQIWPEGAMPMIQTQGQPPGGSAAFSASSAGLPPGTPPVQLPPASNVMPFPAPPIPERPAPEITPEEENVRL